MIKTSLLLLILFFCVLISTAQIPQSVNYQAIARDASGNTLANQPVSFRLTILDGYPNGSLVYMETQRDTTNQFGLFSLEIGRGTAVVGTFASIPWGTGHKFLKVEFDSHGGTSYQLMGVSEMLSVPFALYALNSGNGPVGATGPVGPTGDIGPTGATGITGPTGNAYASGTVNYVAKFTPDSNSLGNSQIFDDGIHTGIGNATPHAKLSVNGSAILKAMAISEPDFAGDSNECDNCYNNVAFADAHSAMTGISIRCSDYFEGSINISGVKLPDILQDSSAWYGAFGLTSAGSLTNTQDNGVDNAYHHCNCPDNSIATGIEIYATDRLDGRMKLRCTSLISGLSTTNNGMGLSTAFSVPMDNADNVRHMSLCPAGTYVKGISIYATGKLDLGLHVYCTGIKEN